METFKVILNDEEENGVFAISHVLDPAIEAMYVFMGNEKDVEIKLATVSDEKRIVVGPVLIPNQLILRKHPTTGDPFNIFLMPKQLSTFKKTLFLEVIKITLLLSMMAS